ncbi:nucleotidyltransferase domain-containing protein [Ferdinandcohnia sp. Marseille-Q9671]
MEEVSKLHHIEAAKQFVFMRFPNCQAALLAGSVVRNESTETSDLDIIVFDNMFSSSYRESVVEFGWAIEVFVHTTTSYKVYFESDAKRARPSMPRMVAEGLVLKDNGILDSIKQEARDILLQGPEAWTTDTIKVKRYFLTDALYDFIGCENRREGLFIASSLAELTCEFVLRTNGKWIGTSKWVYRSLREYDETFADTFVKAFDAYFKTGKKESIVQLVDDVLAPYGGRLFEGFSIGK